VGNDSLGTATTLSVNGKDYRIYSLAAAEGKLGDISRLPFSLKVLLENMLRHEDGSTVSTDDAQAIVDWQKDCRSSREIAYRPARVLMQDFTGVPAVVDLAAMRGAMAALGGDAQKINPQVPVDLVIDLRVMVDTFVSVGAFKSPVVLEMARKLERYAFLRWCGHNVGNFGVTVHSHDPLSSVT